MPREKARALALMCLQSPKSPPKNHLEKEPRIARNLSSYNLCKSLNCLPDDGGLLDQGAEWVAFATVFSNAEAELDASQT
jgi:hypothetical protein